MLEYTLYVDVWLLRLGCNFVFEYLLLWATATITRTPTTTRRLALGALVGTLHYLLYLLASLGLLPLYGLLRFLPVVFLVSLAMIAVAFYPLAWRRVLKVAGYFHGIGFVAGGMGMAAAFLLGSPGTPAFTIGTIVSILAILLIAELGWGIVHERIVNTVYRVPLEIVCDGQCLKTTALVDTGNQLKDPLNRQAVIIVDLKVVEKIVPPKLKEIMLALDSGDASALDELAEVTEWQTRLRLIPFSSIGKNNGMLVGFRADEVKIGSHILKGEFKPTIAIHPYNLDPNGEYMALVPPHLVEESLHLLEGGERVVEAPSSDIPS